jgi:outer membrane protein assembly factor BamB
MQNLKNKPKISAMTFVILLTFAATIVTLPLVTAHDPAWEIPTWCYISIAAPNPIGVNQQLVVIFWCNSIPPTALGASGDRWNFNIKVTTPDGSTEILGPFTSDPVGGGWTIYTPTQVGTYTLMAEFVEHTITGLPVMPGSTISNPDSIGDIYLASTSEPVTLIVQEDPIMPWPETPITTDYWERPINAMNRNWYILAGNWLGGLAQQTNGPTTRFGWGSGPESAHILWATPMWTGGIMDARYGDIGYQTAHYEGIGFLPPIILDGKIYYNIESQPREGYRVLDLYTGEELWFMNSTGPVTGAGGSFASHGSIPGGRLSFGQIYDYESPNQHGGFPYIWSAGGGGFMAVGPSEWKMFDAFTGNYICSINNVPSWAGVGSTFWFQPSIPVYGKDGSILTYNIVGTTDPTNPFAPATAPFYLQCWNTSRAIWYRDTWLSNEYWMWRPELNVTFDGNNGYSLNVSIPEVQGSLLCVREGEFVIGGTSGNNQVGEPVVQGNLWALSLKPGEEGQLLWNITFTPPYSEVPAEVGGGMFGARGMNGPRVVPEYNVFLFSQDMTLERWGYDLTTGQQLWGPTEPESAANFYGMEENVYDGKLLSYGYGGEIVAYDIRTGEVLWRYTASQEGWESPYGNFPIGIACIADGKLYCTSSEHSPTQPLWRGSYIRCINATDGEEIWKILHWGAGMSSSEANVVIADGYIVGLNFYDNQIYCYGKGPSETTVTIKTDVVSWGSHVMITGSVTDQSPGAKGAPAIADEYMSEWMEYLYMQQPMPTDAQGVTVKLTSIDPNGNFQDIGTATADSHGNFGKSWLPPVPGEYYVLAEFEGTASYGSSSATTYFVVEETP